MKLNHAFGFLLLGTVFGLLPRFAPGWCPVTGVDGTSARELWLQLMGAVQIGVALAHIGRRSWCTGASFLAYAAQLPLAAAENELAGERGSQRRPAPVEAFPAGLLEQQRAV